MNILTKTTQLFMLFLLASLLCACSASPDDYGRDIAAKECECIRFSNEEDLVHKKKLLAVLKEGKIKTQPEYAEMRRSIGQNTEIDSEKSRQCYQELQKMRKDSELEFPQQDDRKTLQNSYNTNFDVLRKQTKDETGNERQEIENEIHALTKDLPWF